MAAIIWSLEAQNAIEENLLALVDTNGLKDAEDIEEDKMCFLDSVSALLVTSERDRPPSRRIYEAVFAILEENYSMRLSITSYLLLVKLEKCYAQVVVEQRSENTSAETTKAVTLRNKVWSPLAAAHETNEKGIKNVVHANTYDYQAFITLLEKIVNEIKAKQHGTSINSFVSKELQDDCLDSAGHQILGFILKFNYFVQEIEQDFKSRQEILSVTRDTDIMKGSFIIQIFKGNRRKELITHLLHLIAWSGMCKEDSELVYTNERIKGFCQNEIQAETMDLAGLNPAVISLLLMIMDFEIEYSKKLDGIPRNSRQEHQRISIWDLISDIIGYQKFLFAPLLQILEQPLYKLNIIFNYFVRNAPQPIVQDMKAKHGKVNMCDFLNCFIEPKDARNIYRSIETDTLQLLLAHAFKAFLMQQVYDERHVSDCQTKEVCKSLVIAFENLRAVGSDFEIHPAGRQALISAEILSVH